MRKLTDEFKEYMADQFTRHDYCQPNKLNSTDSLNRTLKFLESKLDRRAESLYEIRDTIADYYRETNADVFKEIYSIINKELDRINFPV